MNAIIKAEPGPGLVLADLPMPAMGVNDVLIKVLKTSICGTDVHIDRWDGWAKKTIRPPMTIGHEFVGQVVDKGNNVRDVTIGEIVSGEGHIVCGRCRNCRAGRRHLCKDTVGVGVNRDGAFAEFISIPVTNVWHADPNIPLEILSCFDPLGNATHTALTYDVLGEDVLITGAGPIGCMAAAIVRHAGARHVVVTDLNPYRLEVARKMGVTLAVNPLQEDLPSVMEQLGMEEGFDVGLEMSGSSQALSGMIEVMCHGGKIALLGILPEKVEIDWNKVIFNMISLKGIYGREMFETWYKMTVMIQGGLDISPVITHRIHYTDFETGFEQMHSGQSGKIVMDWSDPNR
jgi:threonine 3-dehydrogenase